MYNIMQEAQPEQTFLEYKDDISETPNTDFEKVLTDIILELDDMDSEDIKEYIKNNMVEDKENLISIYKYTFADIPLDDPVRLRVIKLLERLFIEPHLLEE